MCLTTRLTCLVGFILECHFTETTIRGYTCRSTRTHYLDSEPTKHIYDFPTWVFEICQHIHWISQRSSKKHITNKHAATLARVDIHRQDDGDGYVEACDQHHDIVGMEELSHDIC
jgi:hypothetical protein